MNINEITYPFLFLGAENVNNYCVYYHKNKINGKLYIGISKDIKKRWSDNGEQYKHCKIFYKAIKKYGWDNFDHVVLIENISKEMACIVESELIQKYHTQNRSLGYNLADGGFGGCTVKGLSHPLSKKIYQYELNGIFMQEWENAQRASEKLNIIVSDIHVACKNKNVKQAGGYMWKYEKFQCIEPYVHEGINKEPILQLDSKFDIVNKYKNISYVDENNYSKDRVINCCTKRAITHNGYYWTYEKDFDVLEFSSYVKNRIKQSRKSSLSKKINQYDLSGNILHTYESARDVEEQTGFNRHTIQAYCKRKIGDCGRSTGFIWKYA